MIAKESANRHPDPTRSFTVGYLAGLFLIGFLIVLGYLLVQVLIERQASDAEILNLAGRQRMLSQNIAKTTLLMARAGELPVRERYLKDLESHTATWEKVQKRLAYDGGSFGFPADKNPEVGKYLKEVEPYFNEALGLARVLIKRESDKPFSVTFDSPEIENLIRATQFYLNFMEQVVSGYERDSKKHVYMLNVYEACIAGILVLILVLESMYIFKPITEKTRKYYEEIQRKNEQLLDEVDERMEAEKKLKRHTKDMEKALERTEDVLQFLSEPPRLIPFFITSQRYRISPSIGGGDSIRWLTFHSKYAGLYLHDVSGHDIQSILLNILATAITDKYKTDPKRKSATTPSLFLASINKLVYEYCHETEHYLTATYSLLDFEQRKIYLALAGHPAPWLISPSQSACRIGKAGSLLGQFKIESDGLHPPFVDTEIILKPAEILLIYTDGLMEQRNSDNIPFEKKFRDSILNKLAGMTPDEAYHFLKREFEVHIDGQIPDDDVSFIFVGSRPEYRYEEFHFTPSYSLADQLKKRAMETGLPDKDDSRYPIPNEYGSDQEIVVSHKINSVLQSYQRILAKLYKNGWSHSRVMQIHLVLMEIVMNALLHGNRCSEEQIVKITHILHGDVVEIGVEDQGEGFLGSELQQTITDKDLMKESGRGLHMIRSNADEVYFNESGNKLWVLFRKS